MVNEGTVCVRPMNHYWDYASLKRWLHSNKGKYGPDFSEIRTHIIQLTTGTDAELEAGDGIEISQIGRAEIAVSLGAAADNASTNGLVYTLTYVNQAGDSTTVTATGTATLATTQVAWSTAVTDFYYATSFTVSAASGTVHAYLETTGAATVWATITAAASAASEAQLLGIGAIYVRSHTNHNDADAAEIYMCYLSGCGLIKYAHGTIDSTDGTTEIRMFEATNDGDGNTTAIATTVKDFFRIRWMHTDTTPTTNCHEFLLCDADAVNDGSGADVYGVILESNYMSVHTRYCTPKGYEAWLACWKGHGAPKVVGATTDTFNLLINYYADGCDILRVEENIFSGHEDDCVPISLDEMKDVYFQVSDNAGAQTVNFDFIIVEAQVR